MKNINAKFFISIMIALVLGSGAIQKLTSNTPPSVETQLTFVDVGQGDSIFFKTSNGETYLIDGGEDEAFKGGLHPFLLSQRIDIIDCAIITHYHSDHIGGIVKLLEEDRIERLVIPDYTPENKAKDRLIKLATQNGTQIFEVSEGDVISSTDKEFHFTVLHPENGGFGKDENNNSIVGKLDCFGTDILLTGDLEADGEAVLAEKYDLETDILKVGHHGSQTSSSPEFLAEADPTYAVIQCGKDNSYGHPHYEVLERLDNDDVRIYRTDIDGNITFFLSENGIESINTTKN